LTDSGFATKIDDYTVIQFIDLLNSSTGPAASRWAALFSAPGFPAWQEILRGNHD
jgi:hypothetical protein